MFKSISLLKLLLVIILIPIGLLTRVYSGFGSEFVSNHLGGTIYVLFFIVLVSLVYPKVRSIKISIIVLFATCFLELIQLVHTPALELLRINIIFSTLFGTSFNPIDFIWYFVGAILGFFSILILDKVAHKIHYSTNRKLSSMKSNNKLETLNTQSF